MNRRQTDRIVGLLLAAVLVGGGLLTWQAFRQQQAVGRMVSMMGGSMGAGYGPSPWVIGGGSLLVIVVLGGLYVIVRDDLVAGEAHSRPQQTAPSPDATGGEHVPEQSATESPSSDESGSVDQSANGSNPASAIESETDDRQRNLLDVLPEDERRILAPVIESPGLTQIEVRDRSEFSKSKVSQTVSDLEQRGLLYRERQGRTYRVYPSDDLSKRPQ